MKKNISYSVAIRAVNTDSQKYKILLDCISRQTVKAEKIYVVLPKDCLDYKSYLGYEIFVFTPKSMIGQRLEALKFIESTYTLFCDDDVEFGNDFAEKLIMSLINNDYDFSAGPLLEFLPPKGFKYVVASVLGGACTMLFNRKNYYIRILNTGGYSYNRNIHLDGRIYKTESLPWTVFMANTQKMKELSFEDEMWLEKKGYSAFDDRVMFFKAIINDFGVCVVSDALYKHNDGKNSTVNLKWEPYYAGVFNHYVFWHRFIYMNERNFIKRIWKKTCISYYELISGIYQIVMVIAKRNSKDIFFVQRKALSDAKKYIRSDEYKKLPSIHIRNQVQ